MQWVRDSDRVNVTINGHVVMVKDLLESDRADATCKGWRWTNAALMGFQKYGAGCVESIS